MLHWINEQFRVQRNVDHVERFLLVHTTYLARWVSFCLIFHDKTTNHKRLARVCYSWSSKRSRLDLTYSVRRCRSAHVKYELHEIDCFDIIIRFVWSRCLSWFCRLSVRSSRIYLVRAAAEEGQASKSINTRHFGMFLILIYIFSTWAGGFNSELTLIIDSNPVIVTNLCFIPSSLSSKCRSQSLIKLNKIAIVVATKWKQTTIHFSDIAWMPSTRRRHHSNSTQKTRLFFVLHRQQSLHLHLYVSPPNWIAN